MYEDEVITVYTFSIVAPYLFWGKCSTKLGIGPLPDYTKWRNNSLQTGLCYVQKQIGPIPSGHQDDHRNSIPSLPPPKGASHLNGIVGCRINLCSWQVD